MMILRLRYKSDLVGESHALDEILEFKFFLKPVILNFPAAFKLAQIFQRLIFGERRNAAFARNASFF